MRLQNPAPTASNESKEDDNGYQYEGQDGLLKHIKDVQDYTRNQVSMVAGNVGFAWGGLSANAAAQALKRTSKFVGGSTRAMNSMLERLQKLKELGRPQAIVEDQKMQIQCAGTGLARVQRVLDEYAFGGEGKKGGILSLLEGGGIPAQMH